MAKLSILAGSTSQSVNVFIQDSSSTVGAGLTGLVYNTSSLTAYYTFAGANATAVAISLATLASATAAFSSGGFVVVDGTNMPGVYRLDIPNAALATSKGRSVLIMLKGATNMAPCVLEIELVAVDNQVADSARTIGTVTLVTTATTVTNQLTAAAVAAGVWRDAVAADFTQAGSIGLSVMNGVALGTGLTVNTVTNQLTAAAVAAGVWKDTTAGDFTVSASVGKSVMNGVALGTGLTVNTVTNQLTAAAVAAGVWRDAVAADFTQSASIGLSVMNGVALGTGLTINGYTGNTVQTGDSYARIGAAGAGLTAITGVTLAATQTGVTIPTVTTVTNQLTAAAIASGVWKDTTAGDFTVSGSIGAALFVNAAPGAAGGLFIAGSNAATTVNITGNLSGSVGSVTGNVGGNVVGSVASVTAQVTANVAQINGSSTAAVNLSFTTTAVGRGTVAGSATTTSVTTSAMAPGGAGIVTDQFKNRIIMFDGATTTAALRGQGALISGNTSGATPTFTVSALTTAPASGDTFSVL